MTRDELTQTIREARLAKGLSHRDVAEAIDQPPVWTASALLGQHAFDEASAAKLTETLGLPDGAAALLQQPPYRGSFDATAPPTDPTMYRLYEVLQVYGPALKELIHEEFGDGIMSAISFNMDLEREPNDDGDRVRITMSGKFLPYKWTP